MKAKNQIRLIFLAFFLVATLLAATAEVCSDSDNNSLPSPPADQHIHIEMTISPHPLKQPGA